MNFLFNFFHRRLAGMRRMALMLALAATAMRARADPLPASIAIPVVDRTDLRFTRLSVKDGLSQTRVTHLTQDARGFMWFATQYGLNRYDGYKFKVFAHDPERADSLAGVYISALFQDHAGRLWVGCAGAVDRLDPVTEAVTHFKLKSTRAGPGEARVVNFFEDSAGLIWLATGNGLLRLDPTTGQVTRFGHDPADPASLSSNDVKSLGADRTGTFWVGTSEGLDAFDRVAGKVTQRIVLPDPLHIGFLEDRFGTFWIYSTTGSGLAIYDRNAHRLTRVVLGDQSPPGGPVLTGVRAMLEDDRGSLWLGTFGAGLLRYDRANRRFIRYRHDPSNLESLAENAVIALYEDREGNIWTGLHANGPNHFSTRPPEFEVFRRDPYDPKGLESDFINAMFEDSRGRLWIGSADALLRYHPETRTYDHFSDGLGVKPSVLAIAEDRAGAIWIGTYRQGLARFDEKTGRFRVYRHRAGDPASLSDDAVHRIYIDHSGTMWIGTNDGLNRFDPQTDRFEVFKVDWSNRWSQSYLSIAEDRAGILWLGTIASGLHRFDPSTGRFTVYRSDSGTPGAISDDTVPSVLADPSGAIWVGTEIGLDRFDPATGKFRSMRDGGALLGRAVVCILPDRRGHLWMSTNKGVSEFNPSSGEFRHYSAIDGLPGDDFTGFDAGCEARDGEIFFGGFTGGVAFYPEKLIDDPFVPPMVLTDLRLPYASRDSLRTAALARGSRPVDQISLGPDENSLSLEFTALSFRDPNSTRYRYRLQGLEQNWNETNSYQRVATYATLPPGSYVFQAQGATARGQWSEPGIRLRIEVRRPWWQTWWLRVAVVAALLAGTAEAVRLRLKYLQQRERDFRTLADNAPDMVIRFGRNARCLYVSPSAARYMGRPREQLEGLSFAELGQSDEKVPVPLACVQMVFASGAPVTRESASLAACGRLHFESRLVPEFDDRGGVKSVLAITRDVTEQKRSEEALRKTQEELARVARVTAVGELAASIAHEVNQPLAAVVTNGQACLRWLDRDPPVWSEIRQSVEQMVRDGIRGGDVLARIRALVRKQAPVREALDVNAVIGEIMEMMPMPADGPSVRVELAAGLPFAVADRVQLQQILMNLIRNAIDAMRPSAGRDSVLSVRTSPEEPDFVRVEVIDTGVGVEPSQLERLFDPFFTTKADGLGMGLAICRSIVESHGGRLWAERNPGSGMRFCFTLPVAGGSSA